MANKPTEYTVQKLENWSSDQTVEPHILRRGQLVKSSDGAYYDVGVQTPISADGDSVYAKDIWLDESVFTDWSGAVTDLFDNLHSEIENVTSNDPKTITIHFNRTVVANTIGLGETSGGDFSNVLIKIKNSGGVLTTVIDESAVNTKYTTRTFQLPVTAGFNALVIEFHTADTVNLSNCVILKTRSVVSRGQAVKPDGTVIDLNATAGGNQKFSLEEYDATFNANPLPVTNFLHEVREGNVPGHSIVDKFGKNEDVGTSFEPLSLGGFFRTPQAANAIALRVKAGGDIEDDVAGDGAREITFIGLDETGAEVTEAIDTNGVDASTATTTTWIRMPRAYVSKSGTYAGAGTDSMDTTITIEDTSENVWLIIHKPDIGRSQTQIGQYSIPLGKTAYVFNYALTTDSNKEVDFLFFKRESILDAAPPYQARRTVVEHVGIFGHFNHTFLGGQRFQELTDIGWMCKAASAAVATVDYSILLVDN